MASIRVKLIGFQSDSEYDLVIKDEETSLTLKYLYLYFMKKEINIEVIKKLKFICNGLSLNNLEHIIAENKENTVFVFTNDIEIKKQLVNKVFTMIPENLIKPNEGFNISTKSKTLDNLPLEDNVEEEYNPSTEEIENINSQILECFEDKDFINILRIYHQKPELIKLANSYLTSGSIINKVDLDKINLDEFKYQKELDHISTIISDKLAVDITEERLEIVKKILINFKGHLNLSLRYILTLMSNENV